MPELSRVLTEDDIKRGGRTSVGLDLGPYMQLIDQVLAEGGVGGEVQLGSEEDRRTEKGRLTRAAKQLGRRLVWRTSQGRTLKFVLAEAGKSVPGSRTRRSPAERQAEQTVIDSVMTPDVADVTDTEATTEPAEAAAPSGRRRRRPKP